MTILEVQIDLNLNEQAYDVEMMSLVRWLYGLNGPLRQYFSLSGRLPKRWRKKKERIVESKNVQTTPPAHTASAIGSCPTIIQISRTPRHWKFTQDHCTTRPPTEWCHTNVEATPTLTSVGRHFGFMCLLASEMFLHLTSQKLSQNVFPRPNSTKLVA